MKILLKELLPPLSWDFMSSTIKMTGTTKLSEYLYDVKIAIFNLGFTKRAPYLMIDLDLGCTNQDYEYGIY